MKARLLNQPPLPAQKRPCEPELKFFDFADGTHVVLDVNSLCLVEADDATVAALKEQGPGDFAGLLYSRVAPEFKVYREAPARKIVLNVTHGCNLKCAYCFAAKYEQMPIMPLETALNALALFEENRPIDVCFFGGEPLLAWGVMMAVAEQARLLASKRNVPCKLHVTTNATLIGAVKAHALKRYGFSVLASLDGPEEIHNATRPAKKGNSWRQAMAGIEALNSAGIRPMLRATFTADNPRLIARLDFFEGLYQAGKITGVSIEPAILSEGCNGGAANASGGPDLSAEWHAAAEWYVARVKAKRDFQFFYFRKLIERIYKGIPYGTECGAGRGYLTIGPDGTMYACHREEGAEIGHVVSGFDNAKREPWLKNTVTNHPDCMRCWARYLCGGGCPQARMAVGGSINAETPAVCAVKRQWLAEVIWIMTQLSDEEIRRIAAPERPKNVCKRPA